MTLDINKFIKTIFYFSIPFIVLIMILAYVDPYNVLRKEKNNKWMELKEISSKINYPLYGLQKYYNDPTDVIILGDSRAGSLNEDLFMEVTNKKSTNLAYGGGSIREIIETFWIISKMHKPKEIYIGINFNLYNQYNDKNRVTEANKIRSSLSSYLLSKYSVKSSFLILKSMVTNKKVSIEKPSMTREEFWQYQLDVSGPYFFENYKYPIDYFDELARITAYCKKNKIKLNFFIPPTHIDLQLKIKEYKLEKEYKRFVEDLESLKNPLYDFNIINEKTIDKNSFSDPFHFNMTLRVLIIKIIANDKDYTNKYKRMYRFFNK